MQVQSAIRLCVIMAMVSGVGCAADVSTDEADAILSQLQREAPDREFVEATEEEIEAARRSRARRLVVSDIEPELSRRPTRRPVPVRVRPRPSDDTEEEHMDCGGEHEETADESDSLSTAPACSTGTMHGHWVMVRRGVGYFYGSFQNTDGFEIGRSRALFADGQLRGRIVNAEGQHIGIIYGVYENGLLKGRWQSESGRRGVFHGVYTRASEELSADGRPTGLFKMRWKQLCETPEVIEEAPVVTRCRTTGDCSRGEFCASRPGTCGYAAPGICQPLPEMCTRQYAPVCGCNGETYGNACGAASNGMNVAYDGACDCRSERCRRGSSCEPQRDGSYACERI